MKNNKRPSKNSKKKPAPLNKDSISPTPTPVETLSEKENQEFLQHINAFLKKSEINENVCRHRVKVDDYRVLQSAVSEFLESFITFGYTFDGQRVLIQHYPTPKDKDAIIEFLKNVFLSAAAREDVFFEKESDDE